MLQSTFIEGADVADALSAFHVLSRGQLLHERSKDWDSGDKPIFLSQLFKWFLDPRL